MLNVLSHLFQSNDAIWWVQVVWNGFARTCLSVTSLNVYNSKCGGIVLEQQHGLVHRTKLVIRSKLNEYKNQNQFLAYNMIITRLLLTELESIDYYGYYYYFHYSILFYLHWRHIVYIRLLLLWGKTSWIQVNFRRTCIASKVFCWFDGAFIQWKCQWKLCKTFCGCGRLYQWICWADNNNNFALIIYPLCAYDANDDRELVQIFD